MTKYMLRWRYIGSEKEAERAFDSMTERALFKVSYSPYIRVLAEWVGAE